MRRTVLLIRRSAEYLYNDQFVMPSCKTDTKFWDQYRSDIMPKINWWNDMFKMSYLDFRKSLRQIPTKLISESEFDIVMNFSDWRALNALRRVENTWVIPKDEDDWFDPELPRRLRRTGGEAATWNVDRLANSNHEYVTHQGGYIHDTEADVKCLISCSYAVKIKFADHLINSHGRISRRIIYSDTLPTNADRPEKVRHFDKSFAVKVDSPSSMAFLRNVESREVLEETVRRFGEHELDVPVVYQNAYKEFVELVRSLA